MYYVMQVAPGAESRTEALIKARMDRGLYGSCFHPTRHMRKKLRGEWTDIHEKLIPGYVFITSDSIREFCQGLGQVPAYTRLLGDSGGKLFVPLSPEEARWLECIMAGGTEAGLSQVEVSEGDAVKVLSGPLKDMEGQIKKINLHRRTAQVEVSFMNRNMVIHLGIEMVGKGE